MTPSPPARTLRRALAGPLLLLLLLVPSASAHAVLASADPAPNAQVATGVTVIEFRFTEDVERDYTSGDLFDANGSSLRVGDVEFDEDERNIIRIRVEPLSDGLYEASWKAFSIDTHTTRGFFVFAVGNATLRPGQYEAEVEPQDPADVTRDGFARFAFYAGLFLVLGMPLFALFVLRDGPPPAALFRTAAVFGLVGVAGASVALLFLGQRTDLGLGAMDTDPGRSFLWRGGLLLLASLACALAALRPVEWHAWAGLALAGGAASLLATSLGSHAASVRESTSLYVALDAVHLAMGALWVGGIVAFLHVVWGRSAPEVARLIVRFSPLAMASFFILLLTGSVAALSHMPCTSEGLGACMDSLRTERYVQLVALKLALMLPLLLLGAFNQHMVGPRLGSGAWPPSVFRRVLQAEALVMAIVLLAAGGLAASAPPAREAESAAYVAPYAEFQNFTKSTHVVLRVSPNPVTPGLQTLVVAVHPLGGALENSTIVQVKVYEASERPPEVNIDLEKVTPNEWERTDGFFTHAGEWRVQVLIDRGSEFIRFTFDIEVAPPGGGSPPS